MSETRAAAPEDEEFDGAPEQREEAPQADVEARARKQGWRPREEFRGPEGAWRSAEEFLARAEEEMPILRQQYRKLEQQNGALEAKVSEAAATVAELTKMFRSAEERAYRKARAEIEQERRQAVQVGDEEAFAAAEQRLADLDKEAPVKAAPPPAAPAGQQPDPVAVAWANRNPWFNSDPALRSAAEGIHVALRQTDPHLSLAENLDRVTETVRRIFPAKFGLDDNPRRSEPGAVSGAAPAAGATRVKPRSFDAMPAEAKAAFARYAKMLEGKGKPLTKEEYATEYWGKED